MTRHHPHDRENPFDAAGDPRRSSRRGDPRRESRGRPGFGGFGRPGMPGFGAMPGSRARRGDVQTAILAVLADEPMHGYQVIQELGRRSGGVWNPGPGSIYPTLQSMEDQGLVTSEQVGSKRVFSLTDAGREALARHGRRDRMPWEDVAESSGPRLDLRQAVMSVMAAAGQVERTATDEQLARAVALIDTARKGLYALLAE